MKKGQWPILKKFMNGLKKAPNMFEDDMEALGFEFRRNAIEIIKRGNPTWAPLQPLTIDLKGHAIHYIETHTYIENIQVKVSRKGKRVDLEVFPDASAEANRHSGLTLAQLAVYLEHGYIHARSKKRVPGRPIWANVRKRRGRTMKRAVRKWGVSWRKFAHTGHWPGFVHGV